MYCKHTVIVYSINKYQRYYTPLSHLKVLNTEIAITEAKFNLAGPLEGQSQHIQAVDGIYMYFSVHVVYLTNIKDLYPRQQTDIRYAVLIRSTLSSVKF